MEQKRTSAKMELGNVPTWDEVRQMVMSYKAIARKKQYWIYLALLAFTGARRQEAWNVKVKDLLKKHGEIEGVLIYQTKKENIKKDIHRRINVSSKETRRVPIAREQLKKELEKHVENLDPDSYIFDFSLRTCNNIVQRAGLKTLDRRRTTPHQLRHAFAFRMLEKFDNLEQVRRLLGHANYSILRTYLDSSQMDLSKKMKAALA